MPFHGKGNYTGVSGPGVGGILHLPDALDRFPKHGIYEYDRMSSWSQAGTRKIHLIAMADAVEQEIRAIAPGKLRHAPVVGVEEGKLSCQRPALLKAFDAAVSDRRGPMILAARNWSRFIRAESYHKWKNPEAVPTIEEWQFFYQMLHKVARGRKLVLATLLSPTATDVEQQEQSRKLGTPSGAPRQFNYEDVFEYLGPLTFNLRDGRMRWVNASLRKVAKDLGVTPAAIHKASLTLAPNGKTYRRNALELALERGLIKSLTIDENGYEQIEPMDWPIGLV